MLPARAQSNVFLLDGVSIIDSQVNSALGNFRITDAVQEFAVQTSVATAEFGRGTGGQVSIVTKSGPNQFHGSVFEYFRNSILDAADFFTNKQGGTKNPLHRNEYGATLGGPILKDKLFFFLSYEGFRQVAPTVSSTRVPTAAERASVTDPISKSLLQFWPAPNTTGTNNFIANVSSTLFPFGASKHSWRWGAHIRREDARRFLDGSARGTFNFTNFTDFAAGNVNQAQLLFGSTLCYWRRYPFDVYWQDTYKAKDNFTLNYGVRYEYPSAIYQTRNQATNFIPGLGPVLLGTNKLLAVDLTKTGPSSLFTTAAPFTLSDSGVNADKNNIAPVIGFAYTPRFARSFFGNDDTVIRGGFRVGYDEIFNNIPANLGLNAPFNLTTTQAAGTTQPGRFPWAIGFNQNVPLVKNVGLPNQVGLLGFRGEDLNLRSPYIYQYSLGIQRKLGSAFSLEVDYQGSSGHKLGLFVDQNQPTVTFKDPTKRGNQAPNIQSFPNPFFGRAGTGKDLANSNYNGAVVTARYQGRHGIFFESSYTLGKSIDYGSAFFGSTGEGPNGVADGRNIRAERGPSSFDIRHHAVFVYVMELPVGPGHRLLGWNNGVNRQLFGGWEISGVTTLQSGAPFTVFNTSADFSGFNQFADRPDVIGTGHLHQNNSNPDAAFDTTFFSKTPPTGRVGTSGRDQYYGPGLQNYNFAVAKVFPLGTERVRLRFRADFFNLFNHTNFANPQNDQSSSSFGKITATVGSAVGTAVGTTAGVTGGGARVIQLALRLEF